MFRQINQYSKRILRQLRNIAASAITVIANGTRGLIILPLAAVIALPQRIYYTCKRREILSSYRFSDNLDDPDPVSRELRNLILDEEEIPLNQDYNKFLIQSRTRLPSEIFIYQDIFLLYSGFAFVMACFNDPLNKNFVNQYIFLGASPIKALNIFLSTLSFVAAANKPKILKINIDYLKSTFKCLLNYKSLKELDNIKRKLDIETGEYAAFNFIANSAANLEQAKELIPYCPKPKLKNDFLSENIHVKQLFLSRTILSEMLPPPLIETIQDYCELPAVCISYKNAIKFSSNTTIQMPSIAQDTFEKVVKSRKKGKFHHV